MDRSIEYRSLRVIISGGGTGGHIFPAISIANKLRELNPDTEILFVGAEGKMEMDKVPSAGYEIVGLPVVGIQRKLSPGNIVNDIRVPGKFASSLRQAGMILDRFRPDVVVGVGGYASAPLLWKATSKGIPAIIQEQNGFAGLTNKMLGRRVDRICVAYEGMERFFPADKIVFTGNPIRSQMHPFTEEDSQAGVRHYGLDAGRKHLLVVGGSLGAATLNRAMRKWVESGCPGGEDVDVIWQCGRYYKSSTDAFMSGRRQACIHHTDFIDRMDLAYACADVVISRSGASSVSEICACGKAAVFVPSPNVAEDHQTHNAMALVRKDAALIVKDSEADEKLLEVAMSLVHNGTRLSALGRNAASLAKMNAAREIVDEIYRLI